MLLFRLWCSFPLRWTNSCWKSRWYGPSSWLPIMLALPWGKFQMHRYVCGTAYSNQDTLKLENLLIYPSVYLMQLDNHPTMWILPLSWASFPLGQWWKCSYGWIYDSTLCGPVDRNWFTLDGGSMFIIAATLEGSMYTPSLHTMWSSNVSNGTVNIHFFRFKEICNCWQWNILLCRQVFMVPSSQNN